MDAIPQNTHGGSMRYIISKNSGQKISNRLKKIFKNEKKFNIDSFKGCKILKNKVEKSKVNLINKIKKNEKGRIKNMWLWRSSKSTTILNYCKIGPRLIDCIFDTTPDKINKYSPGMHIPIVDYKNFKKRNYKKIFLFSWNHKKEILKKEKSKKNIEWFSHLS